MKFLFLLIPLILLNPFNWKKIFKEKDKEALAFEVTFFIIGALYSFLLNYTFLVDKNFSAFIVWVLPLFIIVRTIGASLLEKKGCRKFIPYVALGFLWIFIVFVYPLTIKQNLAEMINVKTEQNKLEDTNIEHISIIPLSTAKYKGDNVLGKIENASLYTVGTYHKQKIGNEMFYVAPIEYNGFFSARKAKHVDYYIKVSAERDVPAELVKADIKYTPSAWFGNNLQRMVRKQYPSIIILDESLEPDDSGKPFYAVSYGHYEYFRSGIKVDGVILFDPSNGDMKKYSLKDVPAFVDQSIPEDVAWDYNNWFGKYANGLWNYIFSPAGVHEPTEWEGGSQLAGVFIGDTYYYATDHTNTDKNSTTMVGYSMVNSRTGEAVYYPSVKGINGQGAISAVNKTFTKDAWKGEDPILYSIYGSNTWIVPVVDGNGLLREVAAVNAEDTKKVVHAATKEELFEKYRTTLATSRLGDSNPTKDNELKTITGKVVRVVNISTIDGNIQKLLLEGSDKIFSINTDVMPYSVFTKEGDTVELKYIDTKDVINFVKEMKNTSVNK